MDNMEFISICINEIIRDYNERHKTEDELRHEDVYVVWLSKVLGNNKALLATTRPDGLYFELTYNGTTGELYFDEYGKVINKCIPMSRPEVK